MFCVIGLVYVMRLNINYVIGVEFGVEMQNIDYNMKLVYLFDIELNWLNLIIGVLNEVWDEIYECLTLYEI